MREYLDPNQVMVPSGTGFKSIMEIYHSFKQEYTLNHYQFVCTFKNNWSFWIGQLNSRKFEVEINGTSFLAQMSNSDRFSYGQSVHIHAYLWQYPGYT